MEVCVCLELVWNVQISAGSTVQRGQLDSSVASTSAMFDTSINPVFQLPPGTPKCAIPECPNPAYVDEAGTVHKCCSRSHAREFEARSTAAAMSQPPLPPPNGSLPTSSALPPDKKCAIQECPNPRYVDESGTVHECCGLTHAMEHQRRLALMKRKLATLQFCTLKNQHICQCVHNML